MQQYTVQFQITTSQGGYETTDVVNETFKASTNKSAISKAVANWNGIKNNGDEYFLESIWVGTEDDVEINEPLENWL